MAIVFGFENPTFLAKSYAFPKLNIWISSVWRGWRGCSLPRGWLRPSHRMPAGLFFMESNPDHRFALSVTRSDTKSCDIETLMVCSWHVRIKSFCFCYWPARKIVNTVDNCNYSQFIRQLVKVSHTNTKNTTQSKIWEVISTASFSSSEAVMPSNLYFLHSEHNVESDFTATYS